MKTKKKYKGKWYLVEENLDGDLVKGADSFDGHLEFDPIAGSILTIYSQQFIDSRLSERMSVFLGDTDEGHVTLYSCAYLGHRNKRESVYTYSVDYVFEGGHIYNPSKTLFSTLYGELHNLEEWIDYSSIKIFRDEENLLTIKLEQKRCIEFRIDDQTTGKFKFFVEGPGFSYFQDFASVRQRVQIIVNRFKNPVTLPEILEILNIFQYFLMMFLNQPSFPIDIILYTNTDIEKYSKDKVRRVPFKLFVPRNEYLKNERKIPLFKMIFGFSNLELNFEKYISNWYKLYRISPSSFQLVFERYYTNYTFSENDFLNISQALESYHAKQKSLTRIPPDEYEQMKVHLLALLPIDKFPAYHEFVKQQLVFGNYATLHDRLIDILKDFRATSLGKLTGDFDHFVKLVKWSRNYYTHYDARMRDKAKSGEDLYFLGQRLRIVFLAVVMVDIGFDRDVVIDRFVDFFKNFLTNEIN